MAGRRATWLMKSEPSVYSIDDLQRDGKTLWTGVRNYQARNFMRDAMRPGDRVLFYHSNADPAGVAGVGRVSSAACADPTQFDSTSPFYEPRANPSSPVWFLVEIAFVEKFSRFVTRQALQSNPALAELMVLRRGTRLSIQPVLENHARHIVRMGHRQLA